MVHSVVQLRHVVALLGRFPALSGVDLVIAAGEIVLVHGPNGAGKSTLLRLCAGLVPPLKGTAVVCGLDLSTAENRRAVRRSVGLLAHAGFLYDDLTVEENVRFAVRAAGGDAALIGPALAALGLDGRLRKLSVHALSAGQRRRCALAPLLARRAPLWLLDEPHGGLDAEGRDLLDTAVRSAASAGAAVLFASHDSDRAVSLATRTVALGGGHVLSPDAAGTEPAAASNAGPGSGAGPGPGSEESRKPLHVA